jgi:demethylmenaquinone methyltransferase/2-methoxy-6-polyprenyl-1,4-benzoquinol methylase
MTPPAQPAEPHPVLAPYYGQREEKQRFLRGVFDAAAPHYESIASWGFFGSGHWYRMKALKERAGLKPGMRCLDVAAGTGPTARAAAEVAGGPALVTCVEPSFGMLQESARLLPSRHIQARAEHLPLDAGLFDFVTMGFALRHVETLDGAFAEYCRVLKPGGTCFIMDITLPPSRIGRMLCALYFRDLLPLATRIFTGSRDATYLMRYYWETMDRMVPPEKVVAALRSAGFSKVERHVVLGVFSEYKAVK